MSNVGHFFDLNCLFEAEQTAWIVSKSNPNLPLYKITPSEFKLIKSGIYRKKGNKIDFNGTEYYLSDDLWNKLKILSSKNNINFSDFVISMQEFLNKDLIDSVKYKLTLEHILNLKNEMSDVYIICSKQTKGLYDKIINEIKEVLYSNGIKINNFYYLNENFLNQNSDEIVFKKVRLLLQHAIGYKSESDKFTDFEITKYDIIKYYDRNIYIKSIKITIDQVLKSMMKNTDRGLSDVIKDDLKSDNPIIVINKIEDNNYNPMQSVKIDLSLKNLITKFESFKIYL